jgi:hypothetical protein
MGDDKPPGERLAVLETKVERLLHDLHARSNREWAMILAVFGSLATALIQLVRQF